VFCNSFFVQWLAPHLVEARRLLALRHELHSTHTVTANGFQQRKCVPATYAETLMNAFAYVDIVRQQVVEKIFDHLP